jgi:N-acyl amino acid synthase of PEP-CTERM/exosortase system
MLEQEYDFYLADTDAGKSIHYALRYQVYCLREKFEDPARYPKFLEKDEYDETSAHFIVRSRATGEWLGAMRLIVAPVPKLPVSRFASFDPANLAGFSSTRVAEASRLCTLLPTRPQADFATNASQTQTPPSDSYHHNHEALQASWITVGLIRAVRQYSLANGIVYCFFLISDPLARILRRLGMEFDPVGSPCLHRGWRRPYMHNFKTGYQGMRARSPQLYRDFCRPVAYARFSELFDSPEALPLAACGGEGQAVNLRPNLPGRNRKPARQRNSDKRVERPFLISPAIALRV